MIRAIVLASVTLAAIVTALPQTAQKVKLQAFEEAL